MLSYYYYYGIFLLFRLYRSRIIKYILWTAAVIYTVGWSKAPCNFCICGSRMCFFFFYIWRILIILTACSNYVFFHAAQPKLPNEKLYVRKCGLDRKSYYYILHQAHSIYSTYSYIHHFILDMSRELLV